MTFSTLNAPASSSSPLNPPWTYDVFLSFHGKDIRNSFKSHLHAAFARKGISAFADDEKMERGEDLYAELSKAIQESRCAVVVFSENYAFSKWCLKELNMIVERRREVQMTVLPIFYHVKPSDVGKQRGIFAEAFAKHNKAPEADEEQIKTWKAALEEVSNLAGWHVHDRPEAEVVEEIARHLLLELRSSLSIISKRLVGMKSRVEEAMTLLCIGGDDVHCVGIYDTGGIDLKGKDGGEEVAAIMFEVINDLPARTDDDLPPSYQNRFQRECQTTGNGRSAPVGSASLPRTHGYMETHIHDIEQEAYCSVLRAFRAQSDAITWDKESLITELRKELRVSDEEHRELLSRIYADDIIQMIRERKKISDLHPGMLNASRPVHDPMPSPTVSASRQMQQTSLSVASMPLGAYMQSSSSYTSGLTERAQVANRGTSGALVRKEPAEAASYDPLIGRKEWTRWPEDNGFYEADITHYNPVEISPDDIEWEGEDGVIRKGGHAEPGRGKKPTESGGARRGRGIDLPVAQNAIGKKAMVDIEIVHTDTLIKEGEKFFGACHPDPMESKLKRC